MKLPESDDILRRILALILMLIVTKSGPRAEDLKSLFRHANQILISFLRQVEDFEDEVSRLRVIANHVRLLGGRQPIAWLLSVGDLLWRAEEIKDGKTTRNYFKRFHFAKKAGKEMKIARNLIVRGEYLQKRAKEIKDGKLTRSVLTLTQEPRDRVWGLDSYKRKVLDFIENKLGTESQLLGIWGKRGVGKTFLLRLAYDSYPDNAFFGHIMFIGAGRLSTVSTVQHAIAIKFGLDWPMMSRLDDLSRAMYIFSSLENRRFLLLLDDLEEPIRLGDIGLPTFSGRQQKIILATRNPEICALMGCDGNNTIEMRCLGEMDAWNLFKDEVQNEIIDVHPQVHQLAKQMVAECHGLPVAICAIARAMSTKRDVKNWSNARNLLNDKHSLIQANYGYSYLDILRNEQKNSFLVTSVWPEDGSIPRSTTEENRITTIKEDGMIQWLREDVRIPWLIEDESVPCSGQNDGSIPSAKNDEDESTSMSNKEDETVPWLQEDGRLGWLQTEGGSLSWFEQKEDGSIPLTKNDEDESTSMSNKEDETVPWLQEDGSFVWLQTEGGRLSLFEPKETGSIPSAKNDEDESTSMSNKEDETNPWLQENGNHGWLQTEGGNLGWLQPEGWRLGAHYNMTSPIATH